MRSPTLPIALLFCALLCAGCSSALSSRNPKNSAAIEAALLDEKQIDRLAAKLKELGANFIAAPKPTELRAVFPLPARPLQREVYMITLSVDASGRVTQIERETIMLQLEPGMRGN